MNVRNCGVWCAVGDDVSHSRPRICELISEVGNDRKNFPSGLKTHTFAHHARK